jgi:hypothetical protein
VVTPAPPATTAAPAPISTARRDGLQEAFRGCSRGSVMQTV